MSEPNAPPAAASLSPVHAVLFSFVFPLTFAAMLSDWAYSSTFQVQWVNFAEWLIAGSLAAGVPALLWSLIGLLHSKRARAGPPRLFVLLLAVTLLVNFINALTHAKDAFATMPGGLILSAIGTVLALVTSWIGYSDRDSRRTP